MNWPYQLTRCTQRTLWMTFPWILVMIIGIPFFKPLAAQESPQRETKRLMSKVLTVTGQGKETIPATLAEINLGVESQGKTAEVVQQEVAQRSAAVVSLLKSRQVEKLQTSGISLRPDYSFENNVQRLKGYIATNTVSFQIEAQKAGPLLDESVNAGATRIDSLRLKATDAAIAQARQSALQKATQDAQTQAGTVLKALNFTQQEIVGIQINGAAPPQPIPLARGVAFAEKTDAASTPVEAGEQDVDASVTLQISY